MTSAVSFRNLTKRFGAKVAVDSVTADIPTSSFFGICGPNGAGKTTLLRDDLRACSVLTAGTVEVAGEDVWADPVAAKTRLGMVPDNPAMFTRLTGRELIEFNGLLRGMDPGDWCDAANFEPCSSCSTSRRTRTPWSPTTAMACRRRRRLPARLLHNPRVLFLDEPFAGIDPVARQVLESTLAPVYRWRRDCGLLRSHHGRGGAALRLTPRDRPRPGRGHRADRRDHRRTPTTGCVRRTGARRAPARRWTFRGWDLRPSEASTDAEPAAQIGAGG